MKGVLFCVGVLVWFSPSEAGARKWTDHEGKSFHARLFAVLQPAEMKMKEVLQTADESVRVRLLKEDGSVLTLPFDRLSREDQVYIRRAIIAFWKSNPSWDPRTLQYGRILTATWRSDDRLAYPYDLRLMFYGAPRGSFEFRNGPKVVRSGYCWLKCLPGGGATLEVRQLQRKSKSSVSRAIDRAVKESIRAQLGPKVKFFSRPPKRVTTLTMTLLADGTLRVPASAGNPAGKAAILKRVEPVPGRHGQGIAVEMEPAPGLPIRDPR